jgi:TolA-binding protein
MDDFGNELEEIRREIVESRALSIKTNNLVNALSADVNSIAKRQQSYERGLRWNSAVAYVVTVVGLMLVGKVIVDARVETVRADTKDQRDELERLQKEATILKTNWESRTKDERKAAEFYELVVAKKYPEVLKAYEEVAALNLTKTESQVFASARERARNELSLDLYLDGVESVRTGRWQEAEQALSQSLRYKSDGAHAPNARYLLARALKALGQQRQAIPLLMSLSEASVDKDVMDQATLLLAECQIEIEAYNDAKATLRTFIRRFPSGVLSNEARTRLADIQLHH